VGLFNFIKDAGKKIFGGNEADAAEAIRKEVDAMGLGGQVEVAVEGDKVVLKGDAPSQEVKEKIVLAAGNVEGVAAVDESIATPAPEPAAVFHTVKEGDTLSAIAKKHYGDANEYPLIFEANKPMLSDPDKIYPGQSLRIPPAS
jgi:nucleoid-associated protein YgaU